MANPVTAPGSLFDEIVGVKSFEVCQGDSCIGYTFVAGTLSPEPGVSLIGIARYQHYPETPNPPVIYATYPIDSDSQIIRRARAMDAVRDPVTGFFRAVVVAEVPGLDGQSDILTLAFNFRLELAWMRTYSHDKFEDPIWNDDVPVAVSVGLSAVVVAGNSEYPGAQNDIVLLAYAPSDGTYIAPPRRFATPGDDLAADITLRSHGVTGEPYAFVVGTTPTPGTPD
ncbi:MAG: hypothetical protein KF678_13490 [Phycisphaeraceae bacterium]|nr:hypothetical protein [Phycisphaeraceae bacterium]